MKKILIYSWTKKINWIDDTYSKLLMEKFSNCEIIDCHTKEDFYNNLQNAEIIITNEVNMEVLNASPNLKWIQSLSSGVGYMPLDEIRERNIFLTNLKGIHGISMSEYVIGYMINMARNSHLLYESQSKKKWIQSNIPQNEIYGTTIGILGLGTIGKELAKKAYYLGMNVLGVKRSITKAENVHKVYEINNVDEVYKQSDYIVNILPYTKDTHGLINIESFKSMKNTSCFISIGRGQTVVEKDLIKALNGNMIQSAVLDVFEDEPLSENSPLWEMDNVIITPHICGVTSSYMIRSLDIIIPNLKAYINNSKPIKNIVNLNIGY